MDKHYRLWTFQSKEAIKHFQKNKVLKAPWTHYSENNSFLPAYQWMAQAMEVQQVKMNHFAPIWAWHSCNGFEKGPTYIDASMLLSTGELEAGVFTVEFHCPKTLVVLSDYGIWNDILYDYFLERPSRPIPQSLAQDLFQLSNSGKPTIQATLPYLDMNWVVDIQPLQMPPESL